MMERTYGRRKPGMLNDDVSQAEYLFSSSSSPELDPLDFSTQESSCLWNYSSRSNFSEDDFSQKRAKRPRNGSGAFGLNSTLMETQEFGELMENEDEVNFALDGLKKGHQVRIRRAALSSLLSICESKYQRRSLRALGISKSIIDAILGLSLDDIPSNLAAATIFFVLTTDGQDDHFMESPNSIKFLIKLLRPVVSASTKGKPRRNIGSRLLSVIKDVDAARDSGSMHDSSSCDILDRAQEILVNCKELRLVDGYKIKRMRPELSTKWVALLVMEKACLSKISFDDTSGTVKKSGGMFKEKLRELGGLDAVFDVFVDCHSVMESWVAHDTLSAEDTKDDLNKQNLILLLKCLKIMENATFLSTENQIHLLRFNKSMGSHGSRLSFPELMISVIKILSGLQLRAHRNENHPHPQPHLSSAVNKDFLTIISSDTCSTTSCSSIKSLSVSKRNQSAFLLGCSTTPKLGSQSSVMSTVDPYTLTTIAGSNTGSFAGRLASLGSDISRSNARTSQTRDPSCKKVENFASFEDSQDPFSFDLEDSGPSKWAVVLGKQKKSKGQKRKGSYRDYKDEHSLQLFSSQEESNHGLNSREESSDRDRHVTEQPSSTYAIDKGCLCLLSDCLLTAVKVLMNLTNDNSVGCREVAACRGLESMAELIVGHFPSFTKSPLFSLMESGTCHQKDKHLTDQELDFLVAILGLLVNLVEKNGINRSRLAAASVPITNPEELQDSEQDMIPLLCSIFLTNQGSADAKDETSTFTLDDEEAVLESEKEAEKMIVEAYSALLLAFLSTESRSIRNAIRDYLPKRDMAILVPVLDRFLAFHTTLDMIPPETHKAVMEVIESCKLP
ncbi:Wings apart-like protein C-terminal [Arabidopsis suecica]|uniref:Wings apart-like protein C-terminal n=1 Tax=Arabidopsis suecica TaxID=45249 RepID=A0A8T2BNT8_ARASU|nr:Wings apart-like protein C-terminal [Arabidopsis suecica]